MLSKTTLSKTNVNTNLLPWNFIEPKPENPNILGIILAFNPARARVLNSILLLCSRYKLVYASQAKIAKMSNISLGTANKEIAQLAELGLIAKKYNGANKPCWYKVSTYFNDIDIKISLRTRLSIFFYFSLTLLISASEADNIRSKNDLRNIYINKQQKTGVCVKNKEGSVMLQQVKDKFKLSDQETNQLSGFSDGVLYEAMNAYQKAKDVRSPFKFFIACCKRIQTNPSSKPVVKPQPASAPLPKAWKNPNKPQDKTAEFLKEEIAKLKAYDIKPVMTAEGNMFLRVTENLIKSLEEELANLQPESTTTNDCYAMQPKTQDNKKDSPKGNLVDMSKYKNHEQAEQIKAWLKTIDYDSYDDLEEVLD